MSTGFTGSLNVLQGTCLRDYLLKREHKRISEREARAFFIHILSALEYLHKSFNVVFRNLNLRNIYIDSNSQAKLGDFLICPNMGPIYKPNAATSSYHFFAPETWLEEGKRITTATDVWTLGVVL